MSGAPGYAHLQGGIADSALGLDRGGPAIGGPSAVMATPFRAVARQRRLEEKGDCGRSTASVVRNVSHAPTRTCLPLCDVIEKKEPFSGSLGDGPEAPVPSPTTAARRCPPPPSLFPVVPLKGEPKHTQNLIFTIIRVDFAVTPMPCPRRSILDRFASA
jgi:hypothetical protein